MKIQERLIENYDMLISMTNQLRKGNRDLLVPITVLPFWIWALVHISPIL
jgi:hypothetical protein